MVIRIKVIPKSKRNFVQETKSGVKVYVTSPAEKGRANVAAINLLSKHYKVKKYHINILSGLHSREKVVELPNHAGQP